MSRLLRRTALVVSLGALTTGLAGAQVVKLNGPLVHESRSGWVSDFRVDAGSARVVYRADREVDFRFELYSRPLDGSAPSLRLNGPLVAGGGVGSSGLPGSFALAQGGRVVYQADEAVAGVREIFAVPADGSAPRVRLSPVGLDVGSFLVTPPGTHVVFRSGSPGGSSLHAAPVDASAAPSTLVTGVNVRQYWASPDGTRVLFSVSESPFTREELFAVPLDGSQPPLFLARAHPPSVSTFGGFVFLEDLRFSRDGRWAVFVEVENEDDSLTPCLSAVPVDGSQPKVRLALPSTYGDVFALVPGVGPERVVYFAAGQVDSAQLDGTQLVPLLPAGWNPRGLRISGPDAFVRAFSGGSTIWRARADASQPATALFAPAAGAIGVFEVAPPSTLAFVLNRRLHSVPLAGGVPLPLAPLPPGFGTPSALLPHPDGLRLLFRADLETELQQELYLVPLDASQPPTRLSPPLGADDSVLEFELDPDGAHALLRVQDVHDTFARGDLLRVPLDASTPALQLDEFVFGATVVGDVTDFRVSPSGTWLVYRADEESDAHFDLHALDESGLRQALTSTLPSVLPDYELTPLGERVVFQTQGTPFVLHVAGLTGGAPLALDSDAFGFTGPFELTPDGSRVVYRRRISASDSELRSAALDGLSPPVVLHGPLAPGGGVTQFRVGPGARVAFLGDLAVDGQVELWSALLDGSAPPLRLGPALIPSGDVSTLELDASGTQAVLLADARVDLRLELYAVPLDGSRAPRRLSGALPTGGSVTEFALTPDGNVVFRADARANNRFELFRVPLAGSTPPHGQPGGTLRPRVALLAPVPSGVGRSVQPDWSLSPDGLSVVYRANATTADVFDLYQVGVDGSTAPAQLSAPMVTAGDVTAFAVAPDQSAVVYLADARVDGVTEPLCVPFAGGAAVALDVLPFFADVDVFRIEPGSRALVYRADRDTDGAQELYRVPLDGSAAPVKLNLPLAAGGDVQADFVLLPGGTVFRAERAADEVFELFLAY